MPSMAILKDREAIKREYIIIVIIARMQFSAMAATSYNPNQQPFPPQGQAAYPPQVAHGYPPQNEGSSEQYPPPTVQGYPPQGYPPQANFPPAYPTQEPPPAKVYNPDQPLPAYTYEPQFIDTTVVVSAQPVTATNTSVSPPEENHSGIAICALVFSLCTLFTFGAFLICLALSIPALILSVVALRARGKPQKTNAGISIGLNVAVLVCTVVLLVAVVTPAAVVSATTRSCSPYYSSTYRTYCVPNSYSTRGSCNYYGSSYRGYCPSSYRCPNFYHRTYGTYCDAYYSYVYSRCRYYTGGYCSTGSRYCSPSFYSSTYSTRCVPDNRMTSSNTPCSYSVSYATAGYCPT